MALTINPTTTPTGRDLDGLRARIKGLLERVGPLTSHEIAEILEVSRDDVVEVIFGAYWSIAKGGRWTVIA